MGKVGSVDWFDLTVPNADEVRDFYAAVVGWSVSACDMTGYQDYVMSQPDGDVATGGVCHAQGPNMGVPAKWIIYIHVASLEKSIAEVSARGGKVIKRGGGQGAGGFFAIIEDPAGAVCALFEATAED